MINQATSDMPASSKPVLKLYNSLTRSLVPFEPLHQGLVTWYNCGPTVYDASHLGHARTYVSVDLLRRVMQNYFGYAVTFVQNVTDVDDKIIVRARQQYLWDEFVRSVSCIDDALQKRTRYAWDLMAKKIANGTDLSIDKYEEWLSHKDFEALSKQNPKFPMHARALSQAAKAICSPNMAVEDWLHAVKDVLLPIIDKESGHQVVDHDIFKKLTKFWEDDFNDDMRQLNVLTPTITLRVSEVVPSIIRFIEKIISQNQAYATSDGSVYFDIAAFEKAGHTYAKLCPQNRGDQVLIEDGEGSLASTTGKKNINDFALWKSSKSGEPSWSSPWGRGRPGWHIECSVMASDGLGANIDIHSGGIDLAFPHHDNELAQSEAYHGNNQWVQYFLHTGHLHIEGLKMSKSLKNFITIKEALKSYSSRKLRLAFMMQKWDAPMDFKADLLQQIRAFEESMTFFFAKVDKLMDLEDKLVQLDESIELQLEATKSDLHRALCDNINTPAAIEVLSELVRTTNVYLQSKNSDWSAASVKNVSDWISNILAHFGFPLSEISGKAGWADVRDWIIPYIKCASKFRDEVRKVAIAKKNTDEYERIAFQFSKQMAVLGVPLSESLPTAISENQQMQFLPYWEGFKSYYDKVQSAISEKAPPKTYLSICDDFRDKDMAGLGVSIDDSDFGGATIALVEPNSLIATRERKRQQKKSKKGNKV